LFEEACVESQLAPAALDPRSIASLGVRGLDDGDWPLATEAFHKLLELNPRFADAHLGLGTACWKNGEVARAETHLAQALRLKPRSVSAVASQVVAEFQAVSLLPAPDRAEIAELMKKARAEQAKRRGKLKWTRAWWEKLDARWQAHRSLMRSGPLFGAAELQRTLAAHPENEDYVYTGCPVCGHDRFRTGFAATKLDYTVVHCASCDFLFRNPTYRPKKLVEVYNGGYLKFLSGDYAKGRHDTYMKVLDRLGFAATVNGGAPGRILDVGCGFGLFIGAMRERGWDVYGMDFAEDCIAHARDVLGFEHVSTGFLTDETFEAQFFDAVTLWSVAAHLEDPIALFTSIQRILKPGGVLVIYTIDADSLTHKLQLADWGGYHKNHLIFFTREHLRQTLAKAGLEMTAWIGDPKVSAAAATPEDRAFFEELQTRQNLGTMMAVSCVKR
jgi:2-polyprenyl-3-methyl-5-hydroxy-6-metoxy-1,4-benzoquinol methylase